MEPEALPVVVRDIFPGKVTVPRDAVDEDRDQLARIGYLDGERYTLRGCRVVVTRERLYVWATPMGFPAVVYERRHSGHLVDFLRATATRDGVSTTTADGGYLLLAEPDEAAGCGCGSPLKSLQPFVPYRTGPL